MRVCNLKQGEVVELEIPRSPEYVAIVRHAVEGIARRMQFDCDSIEDLILAVGEACNNAVIYSCPNDEDDIVAIRCIITADGLMIEIRNHTSDCDFPIDSEMPTPDAEGGRGLYLIRKLVDEVDFLRESGAAILKMHKRLHARMV